MYDKFIFNRSRIFTEEIINFSRNGAGLDIHGCKKNRHLATPSTHKFVLEQRHECQR